MKNHFTILFASILLCFACSSSTEDIEDTTDNTPPVTSSKPNIILIIADDVSKDAIPNYTEGSVKANMPNLQNLMSTGITFDNAWTYSVCSPTRASIISGKYGLHTGVIQVGDDISTSETTVQQHINNATGNAYATAIFGKWHITGDTADPQRMGIDHFAGVRSGGVGDYYNWSLLTNGVTTTSTEYITSKLTDLAIEWKNQQTKPWFLWMAYNAPHTPFHLAPTNLHSQGNLPTDTATIDANPLPYYISALEALDAEMGRLLNSLTAEEKANTVILFVGDNGAPNQVAQSPYSRRTAKNSLYQGGINMPMVVSGVGVNRMGVRETALINSTDFFTTIGNIAGVSTKSVHNSQSFYDLFSDENSTKRDFVYSEKEDGYTVRNATYKYLRFTDGTEQLYNLVNDPYEATNLENRGLSTEDEAAKAELIAEANRIRS